MHELHAFFGFLKNLNFLCKVLLYEIHLFSVEHILNIVSIVHTANQCVTHRPNADPIKDFFMTQLSPLFAYTSYASWKAFFGKVLNVISTFLWSFTDVFLILMSIGLTTLFKQLNKDLMKFKGKVICTLNFFLVKKKYK